MDTGGAGDRMRNAPMAMATAVGTEVGTAVNPIAGEITSTATIEPKERHENRTWRRRSKAPAPAGSPRDWKSRMESMAQQQPRELAQVRRTNATMASVLETQTAL